MSASEPRFSPAKSLLFSTLLVAAFFGGLEGALRLAGLRRPPDPRILLRFMDSDIELPFMHADPDLFWSPEPGFRGRFMDKPVTINALGLRGAEVAPGRSGRSRRVLCFGDSITFGYGLGDEETYPRRLGLRLADRGAEVINAGVTGYTSHQTLGLLRRLLPRLQPDVVTLCIGWNDSNRRTVDDREWQRRLSKSAPVEGTLGRLALFQAMRALYARRVIAGEKQAERATRRVPLPHYRENLAAFVAECRAGGVRPIFVDLPHRREPGEAEPDHSYRDALAETAGGLGVPLLDVGELGLLSRRDDTQELFIDTLHFSPEGAEMMSHLLADQLAALGLP